MLNKENRSPTLLNASAKSIYQYERATKRRRVIGTGSPCAVGTTTRAQQKMTDTKATRPTTTNDRHQLTARRGVLVFIPNYYSGVLD